jgi:hypothetical protein
MASESEVFRQQGAERIDVLDHEDALMIVRRG